MTSGFVPGGVNASVTNYPYDSVVPDMEKKQNKTQKHVCHFSNHKNEREEEEKP